MRSWITLALTLVFSATLTLAQTPAATPAPAATLTAVPTLLETSGVDEAAIAPAPCGEAAPEGVLLSPSDLDAPDFTPAAPAARPKRGYCACGCSFTPDCSTDADCGGGRCLRGPTCC